MRVFERFNVGLTVVHGAIDAEAGSLARLQLNLLATFAELERDMIGERLADARATKKARGERAAGRVPLGYAADPKTKQLVIVESEATVVRWFFTEAGSGKSTAELVARANALRLIAKNGKRGEWSARSVLRLLQNPVYAGRRPDGAAAVHTALLPVVLYERVQAAIVARKTRATTTRSKVDERDDPFLLRGLLVCEGCGRTMTTSMSTALTKKTAPKAPRYYRGRTDGCDGGQIAASAVEGMVLDALRRPQWNWPDSAKERLGKGATRAARLDVGRALAAEPAPRARRRVRDDDVAFANEPAAGATPRGGEPPRHGRDRHRLRLRHRAGVGRKGPGAREAGARSIARRPLPGSWTRRHSVAR